MLGFHNWKGCKCSKCAKIRDKDHNWKNNCTTCSKCGKTQNVEHNWTKDCEKCEKCGTRRENKHDWTKDCNKCSKCGKILQPDQHDWTKNCNKCSKCGKIRHVEHNWSNGNEECLKCGLTRTNQFDWIKETSKNMEICGVSVNLAVICESCNAAVPINGITTKVKCHGCQEIIGLSGKYKWTSILNYHNPSKDIFEITKSHKYGVGENGAWIKANLNTQRIWPQCFKCNNKFEKEQVEKAIAEDKTLTCKKCSNIMQLKAVPEFFKQNFPFASYVIDHIPQEIRSNFVKIENTKPIIIKCAACGGALPVDGSKRMVECEYCHSTEYLPDNLWLTLHQTAKREKWYILFYIEN